MEAQTLQQQADCLPLVLVAVVAVAAQQFLEVLVATEGFPLEAVAEVEQLT